MMKTLLRAALCLLAFSGLLTAQTNVITGNVSSFNLVARSNITVTMNLVGPLHRVYNGKLISDDSLHATSDAAGNFAFTNVIYGRYQLVCRDSSDTSFNFRVYTNTLGEVTIGQLVSDSSAPIPNPATNYYTMPQVDALIATVETGGSGATYTNRGDLLLGVIEGRAIGTNVIGMPLPMTFSNGIKGLAIEAVPSSSFQFNIGGQNPILIESRFGTINTPGVISAGSFVGDGSTLTNLSTNGSPELAGQIASTASALGAVVSNAVATAIPLSRFGVVGDGVTLYSVVVSSGTVTASNAVFTSADVGKIFKIYTGVQNTNWVTTTIATFVDSTHVTVATNFSVSGVVQGVYGSNNRAGLTNAYETFKRTGAKFFAPVGQYLFDGKSFRDGVWATIHLPNVTGAAGTNPGVSFELEGGLMPVLYPTTHNGTNSLPAPLSGTIFHDCNVPVAGATNAFFNASTTFVPYDGSGFGNDWNRFTFRKLVIRTGVVPEWQGNGTVFDGLRLKYEGGFQVFSTAFDVDYPTNWLAANGDLSDTNIMPVINSTNPPNSAAIRCGTIYNFQGCVIDDVTVMGWPIGVVAGEHTEIGGIGFNNCGAGLYVDAVPGISGVNIGNGVFFTTRKPIIVSTNGAWQKIHFGLLRVESHDYATGFEARIYDPQKKGIWTGGMWIADAATTVDSTNFTGFIHGGNNAINWWQTYNQTNAGWLHQLGPATFYGGITGNGANLTNLNASQLSSGTVPNSVLTNLNRTNLTLVNPTVSGDLLFNGGSVGVGNADGKMRLTNSLTLGGNTFGPAIRIIGRTNDDNRSLYAGINAINLGVVGIGSSAGVLYVISGDADVVIRSGVTTMGTFSATRQTLSVPAGIYYPSNTITMATVVGNITNNGGWVGMISNCLMSVTMSNNTATWKQINP